MSVTLGHIELAIGINHITERARGKSRHPAYMAARKRNLETVGSGVGQAMNRIGPEVVVFSLLAVGDYRRTGCLELPNRVSDGGIIERIQAGSRVVARLGDRCNEFDGPWNASDRFSRNLHERVRAVDSPACRTPALPKVKP